MWVTLKYNAAYEVHTTRKVVKNTERCALMKVDKHGCVKLFRGNGSGSAQFKVDDLVTEAKGGEEAKPRSTW